MFILSIDVGIKNLAHCLVEINNNSYKIILWDSINLSQGLQPLCQYLCKKGNCNQIAKFTKQEINYCTKHSKLFENTKSINNSNVSDIPLPKIGVKLKEHYDLIFKQYNIDKVIIENQISPLAARMKTLQGMITQYFIDKNIHDIEYISAINKLKNYSSKKLNYSERKKLGIKITTDLLEYHKEWKEIFKKSKKKDDMADTLLQVDHFIRINNLINA